MHSNVHRNRTIHTIVYHPQAHRRHNEMAQSYFTYLILVFGLARDWILFFCFCFSAVLVGVCVFFVLFGVSFVCSFVYFWALAAVLNAILFNIK